MELVVDAGNTLIKTAIYSDDGRVASVTLADWSVASLAPLIAAYPAVRSCLVCSTRELPAWLPGFLEERGIRYYELSHRLPLPITLNYETPETLGKDRIAAAAGAAARFPGRNVLTIDAGTALTLDLVTAGGVFEGGNISPGLRMRFDALHRQTFSLPAVEPELPVPLIGKNTREAILAGVVNGITYEIDNSINSLKNKYNDLAVILTGGDAPFLSGLLKNAIFVEENLVLSGLNAILRNFSFYA